PFVGASAARKRPICGLITLANRVKPKGAQMPRSTANPPKPRPTIRRRPLGTKRPAGTEGLPTGPGCTNPNPKENTMFRTFATAALLALAIGTAQAGTPPAISVLIGDLNLSNPRDVRTLANRAEMAAEEACADWKPGKWERHMFYKKLYASCVDTTSHRVI